MARPSRILIVDDEPSNALLLETMLESFGYETEVAHDGLEAMEKLTPHVDLILSDIMMPQINGYELCRRVRAKPEFKDLPVIMVTVLDEKNDRLRAVEAGANDFITKPVDKLELQVRVASLLRMKEAQDAIKSYQAELEVKVNRRTAELKESEERFRYIFEATQDLMFMKDRHRRYTHVNPAMLAVLEMDSARIIGKTDEELFSADWTERMKSLDNRVLQGQTLEAEQSLLYSERPLIFSLVRFPLRDASSKIMGLCGIARDITERRARESEVRVRSSKPQSNAMQTTLELICRAAKTDSLVLLTGETGSGKDYLAEYLHRHSGRASGPYFAINCAAVAPNVAESELFGHEAGSFTGARGRKRGLLELAEGGTLLLNEIGELSQGLQAKLLTFLDTRSFTRVGGMENIEVNARLIAATNRDLRKEVEAGRFRHDLYHRLNVFSICVPPLRERLDGLPVLIDTILNQLCAKLGRGEIPTLDERCISIMSQYHWPGNVRELRNVLERALILLEGSKIKPESIRLWEQQSVAKEQDDWFYVVRFPEESQNLNDVWKSVRTELVKEALRRTSGVRKNAANLLGISVDSFKYQSKTAGM